MPTARFLGRVAQSSHLLLTTPCYPPPLHRKLLIQKAEELGWPGGGVLLGCWPHEGTTWRDLETKVAMKGAGREEGTLKELTPLSLPPVGPESWSPGNLTHRALEGRKGLESHTAYLGGLKEYCMCPQELRSDRQCTQRGGGKQEKGERCKVQKTG